MARRLGQGDPQSTQTTQRCKARRGDSTPSKGSMADSALREAFNKIDKDGGGTLDKDEITAALREANKTEKQITELLDRCHPARVSV